MGEATQFLPEKLVMAVLISRPERKQELLDVLGETWGAAGPLQPDHAVHLHGLL